MENSVQGRFWISKEEHSFLGKGRIELLLNIDTTGSISKAAKAMKMSYKAAWDAVDAMNNLSEFPLVESLKGGKGGGGTHLTAYAKELIGTYEILQEEHRKFLESLSKRVNEKNGHFNLLKSLDVRISARNQLKAKVQKIEKGIIESEIFLKLQSGDIITAVITNDSLSSLGIYEGTEVYALFKANALTISSDTSLVKSNLNRFIGKVIRIEKDSFNAEVILELNGGNTICSTISIDMFDELNLKNSMSVSAFCKPKSIILAIW